MKGYVRLDNRWVVSYNMFFLKIYRAQINVELCNKRKVLKYLLKYVTKGHDCAKIYLQRLTRGHDTPCDSGSSTINKVREYLDCWYIHKQDAVWRILGFDIHRYFPSIEGFVVHLTNMNNVRLHPNANLMRIVSKDPAH